MERRTQNQNEALHLYFEMVSRELQNQGQTMRAVVNKIPFSQVAPTKQMVKNIIWRPLQTVMLGKESTTDLSTAEVNQVYEEMSRWLSEAFQISLPFPSVDTLLDNERDNEGNPN